jgi:hypothetical protein
MSIEVTSGTASLNAPEHSKKITLALFAAANLLVLCLFVGIGIKGFYAGVWDFTNVVAFLSMKGMVIATLKLALVNSGLVFILAHIGVASIFKSKRNSNSRWNIARGWVIASLVLQSAMVIFYVKIGAL